MLHSASYLAFLMTLWVVARSRLQQKPASPGSPQARHQSALGRLLAADMLSHAVPLAHLAAQRLSDFRERYGFNVSPAWLIQLQGVTAGVLLQNPELVDGAFMESSTEEDHGGVESGSRIAFEEVFRGLLGTSVQVMIARAIARMTYHNAHQRSVSLSPMIQSLLRIMSKCTWDSSDLWLIDSSFPNYAVTGGEDDRERMTEMLRRWEEF